MIIIRSGWIFLLLAFVFFGLSLVVDLFLQNRWHSPWRIFFEDGFKLLGIVSWSCYLIQSSLQTIAPVFAFQPSVGDGVFNIARP